MAEPHARVVLLGLDGFPPEAVEPRLTPRLWALGEAGGRAPEGGRCALPATTYPGFATLLSGRLAAQHGVRATLTAGPRPGVIPGWAGARRVSGPTLFSACRAAGLPSAAVLGDHALHEILAGEEADLAWPSGGAVPPGTPLDAHGYPTNDAVRPRLLEALRAGPAFLFGHLNEADTWGHDLGPAHPDTRACYARTDRLVGEVADALADDWARTVLIVVSDHGMEPFTAAPPLDLSDASAATLADLLPQGAAALARLHDGVEADAAGAHLASLDGVARWQEQERGVLLLEAAPGRAFAAPRVPGRGGHHGG